MTVELFQAVLGWSALINLGVLLCWFLLISIVLGWIYELHHKFYSISRENFFQLYPLCRDDDF